MSATPVPALTKDGVRGGHGHRGRGHHRRSQNAPLTGSGPPSQSSYLAPPPQHHRRTPSSPLALSFTNIDEASPTGEGNPTLPEAYSDAYSAEAIGGPGPDADATDDDLPFQGTLLPPPPKPRQSAYNGNVKVPEPYSSGGGGGRAAFLMSSYSRRCAITGALLTLPYVVLPLLQSLVEQTPLIEPDGTQTTPLVAHRSHLAESAAVASVSLLGLGLFTAFLSDRDDGDGIAGKRHNAAISSNTIVSRAISTLLPFYSACLLGGERVVAVLFVAVATGVPTLSEYLATKRAQALPPSLLAKHRAVVLFMLLLVAADVFSVGSVLDLSDKFWGYTSLLLSAFLVRPHWSPSQTSSQSNGHVHGLHSDPAPSSPNNIAQIDIFAGGALAVFALFSDVIVGGQLFSLHGFLAAVAAGLCGAASVIFSTPSILRSVSTSLFLSCLLLELILTFIPSGFQPARLISTFCITSSAFVAARFDLGMSLLPTIYEEDESKHRSPETPQKLEKPEKPPSAVTVWLLGVTEGWPFIQSILRERDSRRIFYFMLLNLSFMTVQFAYGIATGSLGLISDSIHMLFDCFALAVGLAASIMSKWPPSPRFPYGYAMVDPLAGLGNGVFLMIISIEIVYEAIERLYSAREIQRIGELFVVSTAGLLVNLVGIFAFEHGHHGHSHGGHDHGHSHDHGNDNMHGIFLHIMADALGSVAVVGSTILVHYFGWSGFDPLASCIIAVLIFISSIPLVTSTAKTLLLSLPGDVEYRIRDALGGLNTVRGVVSYTVPKFWLDNTAPSQKHGHGHHHDHDHDHDHHHGHNPHQDHFHSHGHGHGHSHGHGHGHGHDHHEHSHEHDGGQNVDGVIHIIAAANADLGDVHRRTTQYLRQRNMNPVIQVERETDKRCWCRGQTKQ